MNKKRIISIIMLIILMILSLGIDAREDVNLITILQGNPEALEILFISRIPRTITILLTASALSVAGLIMQAIGRNKFVAPSIAGTTQAAALGILLTSLLIPGTPIWGKFIFSFSLSMLATFFFLYFLNKIQFKNEIYIPLIGLMFGSLIGALTTLIAQMTNTLQVLNAIGVGSFTNKTIGTYEMILLIVPALIFAFMYVTKFSIVSMGKDFSQNLGVKYNKVLTIGLLIVSLISASTYIVVGPLPFLGLIIPNIVSIYYGDNLKKNIWDIAIFGSIFVFICDLLARTLIFIFTGMRYELSVGFIMGIIGSIIFLWLIFRRVKHA